MGQIRINDRTVDFDDEAAELGVKHLLTMEAGERESIFKAAKAMPSSGFKFEDRQGRNFTLLRISSGVYKVIRRGSDSGGWF
jgi:hypothetical protein